MYVRTDLAEEAHFLWQRASGSCGSAKGIRTENGEIGGLPLSRVDILDDDGARAVGKPVGTYLTLDIGGLELRDREDLHRGAAAISSLLAPMLPSGTIFVAGLGNRRLAADALGPFTAELLPVTRHVDTKALLLRPVAAMAAGVLGDTGMEAGEWIRGGAETTGAEAVILIDALAAWSAGRLCTTVQLSDTGLIPGSGVGNHRMALNSHTLGVPVLSIGIPTILSAEALELDDENSSSPAHLFVTDRNMDRQVLLLSRLMALGVTLALQPALSPEEAEELLSL